MNLTFIETSAFTKSVDDVFGTDDELRLFQEALLAFPEMGDVMPGCGGLRMVRWRDPRRGKGTRGGIRIIYLLVREAQSVLLLTAYNKDRIENLTSQQRHVLASLADEFRAELLAKHLDRKQNGN